MKNVYICSSAGKKFCWDGCIHKREHSKDGCTKWGECCGIDDKLHKVRCVKVKVS